MEELERQLAAVRVSGQCQVNAEVDGLIEIVDVYSINSAVKVLRVDGKLPFDFGYALKGT